jgi:hypothetical protein
MGVLTPSQTALRMGLAMWCQDRATTLSHAQRDWLLQALARPGPLTTEELTRLAPGCLAWAEAFDTRFGAVVLGLLCEAGACPAHEYPEEKKEPL